VDVNVKELVVTGESLANRRLPRTRTPDHPKYGTLLISYKSQLPTHILLQPTKAIYIGMCCVIDSYSSILSC
jgi:hypothetical protein